MRPSECTQVSAFVTMAELLARGIKPAAADEILAFAQRLQDKDAARVAARVTVPEVSHARE